VGLLLSLTVNSLLYQNVLSSGTELLITYPFQRIKFHLVKPLVGAVIKQTTASLPEF